MYTNSDNIVALATVVGKSALSVVRLSGKGSKQIFRQLTKTKKNRWGHYPPRSHRQHSHEARRGGSRQKTRETQNSR